MTPPREAFELTAQERVTPLWIKLMAHFEASLTRLREKNDSTKNDDTETAAIRGEIRRLKALIALNTERPDLTQ